VHIRWFALLGVILLVLGFAVGAQSFPAIVVDDRGREITLDTAPERIVVVGAMYAQIVVDLGAADRVVGIADSPENPPELHEVTRVGASFAPSVELILALAPDLVLGVTDWSGDRETLERVGITVLSTPLVTGVADVLDAIRTLGTAIGQATAAAEIVCGLAETIVRIEGAAFGATPLRAAFLYMAEANTPPYAAGSGTVEGELVYRSGNLNVFADVPGFPQVSLESVLERDPQIVFTSPTHVDFILASASLAAVSAVRDRRVVGVNAADATSTRVAELLRLMVDALKDV